MAELDPWAPASVDPWAPAPAVAPPADPGPGRATALENVGNLALGVGERATNLFGKLGRLGSTTGTAVNDYIDQTIRPVAPSVADFLRGAGPSDESGKAFAKELEKAKTGYREEDTTSWEDLKAAPLRNIVPFALEQGILSIPDMIGVMTNLPLYIAARTGEIGQERAIADERTDATVGDFLAAAPAAIASALMERFSTRGILGVDDVAKGFADIPKLAGKAAVKEAGTEAGQEGVEYVGERAGTKKGMDPLEAGERMLAAAIAGGPFGGAVRAGTGTVQAFQAWRARENGWAPVDAPPSPEELKAFAASDEVRNMAAPEPSSQNVSSPGNPPKPGDTIGLTFPAGPSRRATVETMFDNGESVRVIYDDGSKSDMLMEDLLRDRTAPPPPMAEPVSGPESMAGALTQAEADQRFDEVPLQPSPTQKAPRQPKLGAEAITGLDQANELERVAISSPNLPAPQRTAMLTEAAMLRQKFAAPPEITPAPGEPKRSSLPTKLGPLGRAAIEKPRAQGPTVAAGVSPTATTAVPVPQAAATIKAEDFWLGTPPVKPPQGRSAVVAPGNEAVVPQPPFVQLPNQEDAVINKAGIVRRAQDELAPQIIKDRRAAAREPNTKTGVNYAEPMQKGAAESPPEAAIASTPQLTPEQAKAALRTNIDPVSGKRPATKVALKDFRQQMRSIMTGKPIAPRVAPKINTEDTSRPLYQIIKGLGGINVRDPAGQISREGQEVMAVLKDVRYPGLINSKGLAPDKVREALRERGWLGVREDQGADIQDLYDALGKGNAFLHPERAPKEALVEAPDRMTVLQNRARAAGVQQQPDWNEDDLDAAITEREAMQADADGIDEVADQREAEFDQSFDELRKLYDPLEARSRANDIAAARQVSGQQEEAPGREARAEDVAEPASRGEEVAEVARQETAVGGEDAVPRPRYAEEPGAVDQRGKALPQTILPVTGRAAVQLAAARESKGRGRVAPKAAQKDAGGMFAPPKEEVPDMFAAPKAAKPDGSKAAPIAVETKADVKAMNKAPIEENPSPAKVEAQNSKMVHAVIQGLPVTIENRKGDIRRSKNPETPWEVKMPVAYGYFKKSEGYDGDEVDVFIGDEPASNNAFIIYQKDLATGQLDEHKVMLGFTSVTQARSAYVDSFSDGKGLARIINIQQVSVDQLKKRLSNGFFATKPRAVKTAKGIEDFGEVLTGARKHYAEAYRDRMKEAETVDVATEPLSKSWPEPDYAKLLEDGADPWTAAFVHAARDEIPTKPQTSWKLKGWVASVKALREFSNGLVTGAMPKERVQQRLDEDAFARLRNAIIGRLDLYQAVGHGKSLKGVTLTSGSYGVYKGVRYDKPRTIWTVEKPQKATAFNNFPRIMAEGDTREEAIEKFKKTVGEIDDTGAQAKDVRFDVYSKRSIPGKFIIGKKVGKNYVDLKTFDDVKAARKYLTENKTDLVKALDRLKQIPNERKETNSPRVGAEHRSGADVSPEQFSETFGFRGVQFGNYVEGGRRQADLNEAYDALMDMAGVIGVPAKALSLNGELGLAFGARGIGGMRAPKAHYERGTVVINLTKKSGAGSLAHEWWHELDNYFSRARGDKEGFLTEKPHERGEGVRPQMVTAFKAVADAIKSTAIAQRSAILDRRRTSPYWQTGREMSARSYESYIVAKLQDQGASNDYLANIVSEEYWNAADSLGVGDGNQIDKSYPYPTAAEVPAIRAAFDEFFKTIESRETDVGQQRTTTFYSGIDPELIGEGFRAAAGALRRGIKRLRPDQSELPPAGRDYNDQVADAMAEDSRSVPVGTYARSLNRQQDSRGATATLGWIPKHFIEPRALARKDFRSAQYWNRIKAQDHEAASNIASYRELARPYLELPEAQRKKVDAVLELDRLANRVRRDDGRRVVARNENDAEAELSKPGTSVKLTKEESAALFAARSMFAKQWNDIIRGTAIKFGWNGEPTSAAIKREAERLSPREARSLLRTADLLEALEGQERAGYVPLMRYGDYYIAVKKVADDESLGGFPTVARFERIDPSPGWEQLFGEVPLVSSKTADGTPKLVAKRLAELRKKYPASEGYEIEHGNLSRNPEALRSLDIPAIEKFLIAIEGRDGGLYGPMVEKARDELYEELKAGFKRRARTVPGYDSDFGKGIGSYSHWIANHVSNLIHAEELQRAYDETQKHPSRSVREFWETWKRDDEAPVSVGDRVARGATSAAFYWTMAANPSSAIVTFDAPLAARAVVSAGVGGSKTRGPFLAALSSGVAAVRANTKEGIHIDVEAMARSAEERAFLSDMKKRGEIGRTQELATDFGALADHQAQAFGEYRTKAKKMLDISTSAFMASNELSRVVTALTAFRLASDPKNFAAMDKAWSKNEVYRDQVKRFGKSRETLSRFLTTEAAFEWGRQNRSEWLGRHALGSIAWQFKQFPLKFLSVSKNLMVNMGPEGKAAAALMMASLWMYAGVQGLPFVQDAEALYDWLHRQLSGEDPQVKGAMYRILDNAGLGKIGADIVMRGPLSVAFGADVSNRFGFGDLVSQNQSPIDFLGAAPSMFMQAVGGASRRRSSGQSAAAVIAQASPAAIRNPLQALGVYPQEGIKTQTGTTLIPAKDVTAADMVRRATGFQPLKVSRAYDRMEHERRTRDASDVRVSRVYQRLANLVEQQNAAMARSDGREALRIAGEIKRVAQENADLGLTPQTVRATLLRRSNPSESAIRTAPRRARQEMLDNPFPAP